MYIHNYRFESPKAFTFQCPPTVPGVASNGWERGSVRRLRSEKGGGERRVEREGTGEEGRKKKGPGRVVRRKRNGEHWSEHRVVVRMRTCASKRGSRGRRVSARKSGRKGGGHTANPQTKLWWVRWVLTAASSELHGTAPPFALEKNPPIRSPPCGLLVSRSPMRGPEGRMAPVQSWSRSRPMCHFHVQFLGMKRDPWA